MPNISQAKLDAMIAEAAASAAAAALAGVKKHNDDNRGALWVPDPEDNKPYLADGQIHPVCTHCGQTSDLRASIWENKRKKAGDDLPDYEISVYIPKKKAS